MKNKTVSVIIPAFNSEKTLAHCLDSIQNSTYPKHLVEVIVVDNNSLDKTQEIIRGSAATYVSEAKQGRSYARNRGLEVAKGELVAFVDSDVMVATTWIEEMVTSFADAPIAGAQGPIFPNLEIGSLSLNQYRHWLAQKSTGGSFSILNIVDYTFPMINSAACMYRKNILKMMGGFDVGLHRHEDIDLSKRIFISGFHLGYTSSAIASVIFHGAGWLDYCQRSFSDGFHKVKYLKKWKKYKVQSEFKRGPIQGLLRFPSKFGGSSKDRVKYFGISLILLFINLLGRLVGQFSHRKTNEDTLRTGQVGVELKAQVYYDDQYLQATILDSSINIESKFRVLTGGALAEGNE